MICLNSKHDIEVYLKNSYKILNQQFYNKQLPDCVLKVDCIDKHETRESKIIFDVWSDNSQNKLSEITLSTNFFYTDSKGFINHESVIVELLINMCLLYCFENGIKGTSRNDTYFNKTFCRECTKHGLIEDINKNEAEKRRNGFKWYKLSPDFPSLLLDGFTAKSYLIRENKNSNGKKHNSIKYFCPKCNNSVRATKKVNILCSDCGYKMITKEDNLKETKTKDFKNVDLLDKLFYNPNYGVLIPEDIIAYPKGGLRYVCNFDIVDCFDFKDIKLSLKNIQNQTKQEDEQVLREDNKTDSEKENEDKVISNLGENISSDNIQTIEDLQELELENKFSNITEQDLRNMNPTHITIYHKKSPDGKESKQIATNFYFLCKDENDKEYYELWAKTFKNQWDFVLIDVKDFAFVSETYWLIDSDNKFYTWFYNMDINLNLKPSKKEEEDKKINNMKNYKITRYIMMRNGSFAEFFKNNPKRNKTNTFILKKIKGYRNDIRRNNLEFGDNAEVARRRLYAESHNSNNSYFVRKIASQRYINSQRCCNSQNNQNLPKINFREMRERVKAIPEEEKIKQGEKILSEGF